MGSARRTRRATARMRDGAAQAEAATQPEMPPLDHFHVFPNLPIELQLMIWSFWRADQPVLRHYMSLFNDTRFYAALDSSTKMFVRTASRSVASEQNDPLDPMEHKIRFTNRIQTILGQHGNPLSVVLRPYSYSNVAVRYRQLAPAFAWVNFEKDIFNIENINHRLDGRFRFLMHNIGVKIPKPLAPNHWASRIQTLTLRTDCRPIRPPRIGAIVRSNDGRTIGDEYGAYRSPVPFTDLDDQVLEIMTSLRRILLVMQSINFCPITLPILSSPDATPGGYLDYAAIEAAHTKARITTRTFNGVKMYDCLCSAELTSTEVIGEMRQKLDGMGKQGVELKLVVDTVATGRTHS
ncbi:hypothetical protein PG991_013855 [Apiospora marii]|uniref:2EXR domain-containing protein n=1 Tax=Apiospora marii TaxID=335849 RepID=A0ABR1R7D4_9PEZI